MADVLIRDAPVEEEMQPEGRSVTRQDLEWCADTISDLADPDVMAAIWR